MWDDVTMKVLIVMGVALTLVLAPGQARVAPHARRRGRAERAAADRRPGAAQLELATDAGLGGAIRVALTWARGRKRPEPANVIYVRNAIDAAAKTGTTVYIALYPFGSPRPRSPTTTSPTSPPG
jgi:hypothetical protein